MAEAGCHQLRILQRLAKRKLIVSQNGPKGGYVLTRHPGDISVGEVVRALDDPAAALGTGLDLDARERRCIAQSVVDQVVEDPAGQVQIRLQPPGVRRLNSKLEDLASSISVVTKQQMQDFAMLDLNDVFLYEAGTEGTGTYTTGGTMPDPKNRTAGIKGGEANSIAPGDVIVIPPGTAHWFSKINDHITYIEARFPGDVTKGK